MVSYNALSFDGDDYINTASTISLDKNEFTLIYIGKLDELPQDCSTTPLTLQSSTLNLDSWVEFYKLSQGNIAFWIFNHINSESVRVLYPYSGSEPLTTNMYGIRWDNGNLDAIINGNIIGSGSNSNINVIASDYAVTRKSTATFDAGYNSMFKGKLYVVLLYNRALSDTEIQQIYNDPLHPPTDGLVLFYAPDSVDTANGVWKDKSGNGNDGTIYGATYVPLRPVSESTPSTNRPYGLYFDGVDDQVVISGFEFSLDEFTVITTLASYEPPGRPNWRRYVEVGVTNDNGYSWVGFDYYTDGASPYFHFSSHLHNDKYNRDIGKVKQDNNWHMLAWVASITGGYRSGYIDANKISAISPWEGSGGPGTARLTISPGSALNKFNLVNVFLYSRALSDEEIQQIYENPNDPPTDGLVLWLSPESLDTTNGKWLNRAEILNTGLVEQLDGEEYGGPTLIPIRYTTTSNLEEIWELNTLRLNWPWPADIQNRVTINNTIMNTLGGGRVAYVFGKNGDGVELTFYVKQDELDDLRAEAALGSWTIRTPSDWLEYYGDYVVQDVSVKPKVPGVFEATIRLEKIG